MGKTFFIFAMLLCTAGLGTGFLFEAGSKFADRTSVVSHNHHVKRPIISRAIE